MIVVVSSIGWNFFLVLHSQHPFSPAFSPIDPDAFTSPAKTSRVYGQQWRTYAQLLIISILIASDPKFQITLYSTHQHVSV